MIRSSTRGVCRLYSRCFYDIYYGFASLLANPSFIPLEEKARAPGARQAPGGPVAFDGFIAPGGPVEFVGFIAPGGPGALDGSLGSGVVVSSWTFVSTKTISPARRGPRLGCLYRRSRYGRPAGGLGSVFCIYEDDMAGTPGATPPSPLFNPRRPPPRPFDLGGRCRFFVEGAIRRRRRGIQGGRGPGGRGAPVSGARDFSLCQHPSHCTAPSGLRRVYRVRSLLVGRDEWQGAACTCASPARGAPDCVVVGRVTRFPARVIFPFASTPRTARHLRVYEECIACVPCSWGATSGRASARARQPRPRSARLCRRRSGYQVSTP